MNYLFTLQGKAIKEQLVQLAQQEVQDQLAQQEQVEQTLNFQ